MQQSNLLQLIKKLDPREYDDLKLFLGSEYFSRGKTGQLAVKLFRLILEVVPDFEGSSLSKEAVHKKLFPQKPFSKGNIEKVMVELRKNIHTFLIVQHYLDEENEFQQKLDLANIFRKRNLEAGHNQLIKTLNEYQKDEPYKTHEYYLKQLFLDYEQHNYLYLYNTGVGDVNIPNTIQSLDFFYHLFRTELQNRLLLQQKQVLVEHSDEINQALEVPIISPRFIEQSIILLITQRIQNLLTNKVVVESDFLELSALLSRFETSISPDLQQSFNTYLRNICMLVIYEGNYGLWNVQQRLLVDGINKGYLYVDGKLLPNTFYNIVYASIKTRNLEWLETFLEKNRDVIIGDNETQDYYYLNLTNFYFAAGRYEEALEIIPLGIQDNQYIVPVKRLEIMLYFETKSELLLYKISAFKMLISRTGSKIMSASVKSFYVNFINILLQIAESMPRDKNRSELIIKRIQSKAQLAERDWLLEKARQIAKR